MSVYYDPINGRNLNVSEMDLPKFAKHYLNYLLNELNLAPRTIFNYSRSVATFLRWVKYIEHKTDISEFYSIDVTDMKPQQIADITRSDILEFLTFCNDYLDNGSAARAGKIAAIRSMYDFLCKKSDYTQIVTQNPMDDISTPRKENKLPVFLSLDELQHLFAAVDNKKTQKRDLCMIFWLASCGMRLTELVSINIADIKNENIRIYGKGRKERIVPLNTSCQKVLAEYMEERSAYPRDEDKDALFISPQTGKRLTGRRVEQILEGYLLKAGLSGNQYSPHKLRHTAATLLYNSNCADVLELKELLGHKSTQTTEIYTHLTGDKIRESLEQSPIQLQ